MPDPIRAVIADDEPLARKTVRLLVKRDPELMVVAECRNGAEAIDAVREHKPDLLFLDVQMPELDGFDVLEILGEDAPAIVFVTAYDHYAIRAFDVHAIDYLLKPFSDERFDKALARAKDQVRRGERTKLTDLTAARRSALQRLMVRSAGRIVFVKTEEIDWIEAADYYARLHVGGTSYLLRESMNDLERSLDANTFVRIHRSAIVNLDRIREMRPLTRGEHIVVMSDGTEIRLSRSRKDELESRFRQR